MKEKMKLWLIALVIGIAGGVIGSVINPKSVTQIIKIPQQDQNSYASFTRLNNLPDFTTAAANATNAVVYIQTEYHQQVDDPLYNLFFGSPNVPMQGSGSGVIISNDGYIVTNNHVIENATDIKVTLNDKRELEAELIGADPTTDLALLKISADDLTVLKFGNSDNLKVGEWVLAIGNPYSLNSTVTAGIVSAKARDISILKQNYAIESFIQTDAAVNPGNSGGALINVNGDLVGINAAIASPTGSYTGYSFAIPVSIVKKVVADLIEYGSVQRAYLGARLVDIDEQIAQNYNLPDRKGILISSVIDKGAAEVAGLEDEDVIIKLDSIEVNETSELLELLGRHRPGDIVTITARRKGNIKTFDVTLQNDEGGTMSNATTTVKADVFGASFEDLTTQEKNEYNIRNGVKVSKVMSGKFLAVGIRSGFIIQKINNHEVKSADDAKKILDNASGGVYIEGFYPDTKKKAYYAFGVQ